MHLLFYFSCTASVVYDILASEDLFDGNVYLQPPKEGLNSDEGSDSDTTTFNSNQILTKTTNQQTIQPHCGISNSNQQMWNYCVRSGLKMRVLAELHVYVSNLILFMMSSVVVDKTCGLGETVALTLWKM